TVELLLSGAPWITGNRTAEDKYLSTQLGEAEMVMKGCTACYDLSFEWPLPTAEGWHWRARPMPMSACDWTSRRWPPIVAFTRRSPVLWTRCRGLHRKDSPGCVFRQPSRLRRRSARRCEAGPSTGTGCVLRLRPRYRITVPMPSFSA